MRVYIAAPLNRLGGEKLDLDLVESSYLAFKQFCRRNGLISRETSLAELTLLTLLSC